MKRGGLRFGAKELIELLLAIVGIYLIVVYLVIPLVSMFTASSRMEQAKGSLDFLKENIEKLEGSVRIPLSAPTDWFLVSNSENSYKPYEIKFPEIECATRNCICICAKEGIINKRINCRTKGICTSIEKEVVILDEEKLPIAELYLKSNEVVRISQKEIK